MPIACPVAACDRRVHRPDQDAHDPHECFRRCGGACRFAGLGVRTGRGAWRPRANGRSGHCRRAHPPSRGRDCSAIRRPRSRAVGRRDRGCRRDAAGHGFQPRRTRRRHAARCRARRPARMPCPGDLFRSARRAARRPARGRRSDRQPRRQRPLPGQLLRCGDAEVAVQLRQARPHAGGAHRHRHLSAREGDRADRPSRFVDQRGEGCALLPRPPRLACLERPPSGRRADQKPRLYR